MSHEQLLISLLTVLIAILAWVAKTILGIDKTLAVLSIKFDEHERRSIAQQKQIDKNEEDIVEIKLGMHDIRNLVTRTLRIDNKEMQ